MYSKFFFVALAAQSFAQLQVRQLSEDVCDFLDTWKGVSGLTPSIRFNLKGKLNDYPLSTDCVARVESSFQSCEFSVWYKGETSTDWSRHEWISICLCWFRNFAR
jgi:hypothetical protein